MTAFLVGREFLRSYSKRQLPAKSRHFSLKESSLESSPRISRDQRDNPVTGCAGSLHPIGQSIIQCEKSGLKVQMSRDVFTEHPFGVVFSDDAGNVRERSSGASGNSSRCNAGITTGPTAHSAVLSKERTGVSSTRPLKTSMMPTSLRRGPALQTKDAPKSALNTR